MRGHGRSRELDQSEQGFALMEVLIAFTRAAVAIGTLVYGLVTAIRSDVRAKSNRLEMRLAQSRLEAAGVEHPLRPGLLEGELNGLRWRQRTSKANPIRLSSSDPKNHGKPAIELYWVEVEVIGGKGAEVRLATSKVAFVAP